MKVESNKLFYYWQLINQSRSQFITFFFGTLGRVIKIDYDFFWMKARGDKNKIHIIGYQSKKRLTDCNNRGGEDRRNNTWLIKKHKKAEFVDVK